MDSVWLDGLEVILGVWGGGGVVFGSRGVVGGCGLY